MLRHVSSIIEKQERYLLSNDNIIGVRETCFKELVKSLDFKS